MIKFLLLTFVFLAGVFMTEIALLSKEVNETDRAFDYFEKAPRPINTLIVGHCEAATNIAPAYLGKNVFNFSLYDLNFFYQRKLLQRILKNTDVKSVILTINPLMVMGKYKMPAYVQRYLWFKQGIAPDNRDFLSTVLSFGNHSHLWNDQLKQLIVNEKNSNPHELEFPSFSSTVPLQEITKETYYQDGFRGMAVSYSLSDTSRMLDELMSNFDFSDKKSEIEELVSILSLLKDSSIKTTLLLLPQASGFKNLIEQKKPGTEKNLQDTLSFITKQFPEIRIHDFRSDHHIPDSLFSEPGHLSAKGADLFGPQLRKILSDHQH